MSDTRIYVASLSDYNAGRLHGVWIDLPTDDLGEQIERMLAKSTEFSAEEWAIHDHEGFEPIRISEHENIVAVNRLAELLEDHDAEELDAIFDITSDGWEDIDPEDFDIETHRSLEDWAIELADSIYGSEVTDGPFGSYIDWERVGNDWSMDYTVIEHSNGMVTLIRKR